MAWFSSLMCCGFFSALLCLRLFKQPFLRLEHAVSPYEHGGAVLAGNEHGGAELCLLTVLNIPLCGAY